MKGFDPLQMLTIYIQYYISVPLTSEMMAITHLYIVYMCVYTVYSIQLSTPYVYVLYGKMLMQFSLLGSYSGRICLLVYNMHHQIFYLKIKLCSLQQKRRQTIVTPGMNSGS